MFRQTHQITFGNTPKRRKDAKEKVSDQWQVTCFVKRKMHLKSAGCSAKCDGEKTCSPIAMDIRLSKCMGMYKTCTPFKNRNLSVKVDHKQGRNQMISSAGAKLL